MFQIIIENRAVQTKSVTPTCTLVPITYVAVRLVNSGTAPRLYALTVQVCIHTFSIFFSKMQFFSKWQLG